MYGLTIGDLLLFPIYFFIVFLIFKWLRLKYTDNPVLFKFFTIAFYVKMAFMIIYTLLVCYVIFGDSVTLFFQQGKHFLNIIATDPSNIDLLFTKGGKLTDNLAEDSYKGYLAIESNYIVVKLSIFLCFFTFSKYLLINLICAFIAFLGSWQLFMFFYKLYPAVDKYLAFACLGIPMVLFWTSGISKDTICLASLGFLTKSLFDLFTTGRRRFTNLLLVIISLYLIYSIKSYIIISYLPVYLFFLIFYSIGRTNNTLLKLIFKFTIPVTILLTILYIVNNTETLFTDFSSEKLLESVSSTQSAFTKQANTTDGAFFTLDEFDGSMGGLLRQAPMAIGTTFFRPFLWECKNIIMFLSSLEGLILLLIILRLFLSKKGISILFKSFFTDSLIFFCIFFALVFALFVGISSFNFGSLVRYKVPCIPFFGAALAIMYYKAGLLKTVSDKS